MFTKKCTYWFVSLLFCALIVGGGFYQFSSDASEFDWLIEPKFKGANDFYKGVAWVQENETGYFAFSKLIDKHGNIIIDNFQGEVELDIDRETELVAFHDKDGNCGYMNLSGDIVISPDYQMANTFRDGVASVKKNGFYGVIDRYGKTVLPFMYENIRVRDSNMFSVQKGEKWGFINAKGETVIDFIFDTVDGQPLPGVYSVRINNKSGLIDSKGQWILPASYDYFCFPVDYYSGQGRGLIGVVKNDKIGYVDAKGNVIIDFIFKAPKEGIWYYNRFSEGLAPVYLPYRDEKGKVKSGVIDITGKVLFELPGYPRGSYSEGYILVLRPTDRKYGLVDRNGKWHSLPSDIGPEILHGRVSDGVLRVNKGTTEIRLGKYGYLEISKDRK